jgi:hypothetical protein
MNTGKRSFKFFLINSSVLIVNDIPFLDQDLLVNQGYPEQFPDIVCPISRILSNNSIKIVSKPMDNIFNTLVCTSPDCASPGVVKDFETHGGHKEFIMTVAMLSKKITPSKPKFL